MLAISLCSSSLLAPAALAEPANGTAALPFVKFERYLATYEVNADGTYAERYDWALRILDKRGVHSASTTSISYTEHTQDVQILEAYVLTSDGRRIDALPANYRVLQIGGSHGTAGPACVDHKVMTVVFPEAAMGDLVVFSYQRVQKEALFLGHFSLTLPLSRDELYEDVRIRLSAPESMALRVLSREVDGGEIESARGRREWLWTFHNSKRTTPDSSSSSWTDAGPLILASTFNDYQTVGTAYELRSRPKAAVTERVRLLADELTQGAYTPRAQVRAFYDWVSKNIRYSGGCPGSVVPQDVDRILGRGMGDCKDHAVLMQALLDAKNIPSTLALVRMGASSMLPELPVVAALNHVVNYIPSLDLFVDATAENVPFGTLPLSISNKPAVLTGPPYGIRRTPFIDDPTHWVQVETTLLGHSDSSADGQRQ